MSGTLSLLRQAASQVAKEEHETGFDGLLTAADEIANERGLMSPLRYASPPLRPVDTPSDQLDNRIPTATAFSPPVSPKSSARGPATKKTEGNIDRRQFEDARIVRQASLDQREREQIATQEDSDALLRNMNIEPQVQRPVPLAQTAPVIIEQQIDVAADALAQLAQTAGIELKPQRSRERTRAPERPERPERPRSAFSSTDKDAIQKRYLQSLAERSRLSQTDSQTSSTKTAQSLHTQLSRLSTRLSNDKVQDSLRLSLGDDQRVRLLQSMRIMQRSRAEPKSARGSLSARDSKSDSKDESKSAQRIHVDRLSAQHHESLSDEALKRDPTLRFMLYDDAKETTFRPKLHGNRRKNDRDSKDDRKEDVRFSFVYRQEAQWRSRREQQQFAQSELDYAMRVDKKKCPQCGSTQSFDELREKRRLCPHCRVEYRLLHEWTAKSARAFFTNVAKHAKTAEERKQLLWKTIQSEGKSFTVKRFNRKTGKLEDVIVDAENVHKLSQEELHEFFARLEEQFSTRRLRLESISKKIAAEQCPFQPALQHTKEKKSEDAEDEPDFDEDEENAMNNAVTAFLKRYEEDLLDRRERMPYKYKPIRKYRPPGEKDAKDGSDEEGETHHLEPFRFGVLHH